MMTASSSLQTKNPRGGLSHGAYDAVLNMILSRQLTGGSVIQERRMADALGISRTPMREALVRLEGEGWLVRLTDRLLAVKLVTLEEFMNALKVRAVLETKAITLAVSRIDPEQVEGLRKDLTALMACPKPTSEMHWAFDDALHGRIAEASGNPVMSRMIKDLRRVTRLFEQQTVPERVLPGSEAHMEIIDALASGDPERARDAMARHLEHVGAGVLDSS
jgi:DNA-binding GntR family transcriptional regulator